MGKAVPKGIKSKAVAIMTEMQEQVKDDFEANKKIINELKITGISKWTRNIMAGYMSRKTKQKNLAEKRKEELRARAAAKKETPRMETKTE